MLCLSHYAVTALLCVGLLTTCQPDVHIDRAALLARHTPHVTALDTLSSLTVGNGDFAYTVDVTGLQTFPALYQNGIPLGTMSSWGWHSFDNPEHYTAADCLVPYDFGTGSPTALYSQQVKASVDARAAAAADYLRANPHRLHLGYLGWYTADSIALPTDIDQQLDLATGIITSRYQWQGRRIQVRTACHPEADVLAVDLTADKALPPLVFSVPAPTGRHTDDATTWEGAPTLSLTAAQEVHVPYGYRIDFEAGSDALTLSTLAPHRVLVRPADTTCCTLHLAVRFLPDSAATTTPCPPADTVFAASAQHWQRFWREGAVVDFSHCTDPRAAELERRVVLSQYLLAVNSAGHTPPQETGLTYNSWFGKFHLEMIYWHQAWLPLYGHGALLDRTLSWYTTPSPSQKAREIAARQGYHGVRWMKMTDPSGEEAPSKVGSFLIWQQPHPIYLAELLRRRDPSALARYYDLVMQTATFMSDFACYDATLQRFILKGYIPAQETLRAAEVVNAPFELAQWRTTLQIASEWRRLRGEAPIARWDSIVAFLAPLAADSTAADRSPFRVDTTRHYGATYLAAATALDTYQDRRLTSDHPAVLGASGLFPASSLVNDTVMRHTLAWVVDNWNWDKTWGWDYPMVALAAARLGQPATAVDALLMPNRTNTYLPNGHNYQDARLRAYLPGNGGLLLAVAAMCAGWDGHTTANIGWPANGQWDVRWEGLMPLP